MTSSEDGLGNFLLGIPTEKQLVRVLRYLLDEEEFLSPYGIRSLSKKHKVWFVCAISMLTAVARTTHTWLSYNNRTGTEASNGHV